MAESPDMLTMLSDAGHVGVSAVAVLLGLRLARVLVCAGLVWWMAGVTSRKSGAYPTFPQLVDAVVALLRPGRPDRAKRGDAECQPRK